MKAMRRALRDLKINALFKPSGVAITIFGRVPLRDVEEAVDFVKGRICEEHTKCVVNFSEKDFSKLSRIGIYRMSEQELMGDQIDVMIAVVTQLEE